MVTAKIETNKLSVIHKRLYELTIDIHMTSYGLLIIENK